MSHWSGSDWIIALNVYEPRARKRFTHMHEFTHIIDHGYTSKLYAGTDRRTAAEQAEQVADYFAGCVLLPRRLLKRAWGNGVQTPTRLAGVFEVSARAADVRLAQVGLSEPRDRCRTLLPAHQLFSWFASERRMTRRTLSAVGSNYPQATAVIYLRVSTQRTSRTRWRERGFLGR
jgi:Zn-dependent peptidase ImmA (M78 family)